MIFIVISLTNNW